MYDPYEESSEVRKLRLRVIELEKEVEKLRCESAKYLGNWIAAQDLASLRQVLALAGKHETPPETKT